MAVPRNFPKFKPKPNKGIKNLKKHKAKKVAATQSLHNAATDRIVKDVNKYNGPLRPSERMPDPDMKRVTSLEQELLGDTAEYMDADQRYDEVNKILREMEDSPEMLDDLTPITRIAVKRHMEGKDIFPNRADPFPEKYLPEGIDPIEPGDQVIPFSPSELKTEEFGKEASDQIRQNLLERNDSTSEQQFGQPVVGQGAEGYDLESLWYGLTAGDGVEAFAMPGARTARGRFSDGNYQSAYPRGSSTDQHEAGHLAYQHRKNLNSKVRPDIEKYGKHYLQESRMKKRAEELGLDTSTDDFYEKMPDQDAQSIMESIPNEENITFGNYPEDIPRTTWLNNHTAADSSQEFLQGLGMTRWDHYINNSAEMMAEMSNIKHKRAYENGFKGRDNTYEGDMNLLEGLMESPRSKSEEGFRKIHNALKPEEQQNLKNMWFRLGENEQPSLKKALMS